jgi:hypothetical protein
MVFFVLWFSPSRKTRESSGVSPDEYQLTERLVLLKG